MYRLLSYLAIPILTSSAMNVGVGMYPLRDVSAFCAGGNWPVHLFLLPGGLLVWLSIHYYIRKQRKTCEKLKLELESKKNELMKQTSTLTRKGMILHSLLEELEKQKHILGDRYPAGLYARMHSLMEKALNDDRNDRMAFEAYFDSSHQRFIERIRRKYADMTAGDLRICCLLRMNLSTKEIASILNISVRAVELRRYRLRKRIGLDSDTNLADFLMNV
jgi:DNA-binding CsgD family transcriptional regulator